MLSIKLTPRVDKPVGICLKFGQLVRYAAIYLLLSATVSATWSQADLIEELEY